MRSEEIRSMVTKISELVESLYDEYQITNNIYAQDSQGFLKVYKELSTEITAFDELLHTDWELEIYLSDCMDVLREENGFMTFQCPECHVYGTYTSKARQKRRMARRRKPLPKAWGCPMPNMLQEIRGTHMKTLAQFFTHYKGASTITEGFRAFLREEDLEYASMSLAITGEYPEGLTHNEKHIQLRKPYHWRRV